MNVASECVIRMTPAGSIIPPVDEANIEDIAFVHSEKECVDLHCATIFGQTRGIAKIVTHPGPHKTGEGSPAQMNMLDSEKVVHVSAFNQSVPPQSNASFASRYIEHHYPKSQP